MHTMYVVVTLFEKSIHFKYPLNYKPKTLVITVYLG